MQVWKYTLSAGIQTVRMPKGANILSAYGQVDEVCIWALVDQKVKELEDRVLCVADTGWTVDDPEGSLLFIGTALLAGGSLVFHVFEEVKS